MPSRSEFFDYEPVTRRPGHAADEEAESEFGSSSVPPPRENNTESGNRLEVEFPTERPKHAPQDGSVKTDFPGVPAKKVDTSGTNFGGGILRRGHALSFVGLFLFTLVLYFRPYELFASLSFLDKVAFWLALATFAVFIPSQVGLEGNLTSRPREINLVLLLLLCALLTMPFAINPSEAWTEFNDVFIKAVLMFIVMVNVVRTEARLRLLFYVVLAVTVLLSVSAIRDFRAGNFVVEGYRIKGLLGGMFGNPNDLALHFVTMMPLAIGLMAGSRKVLGKLGFGITAVLIVAANVVTYSRGGFLGLLATAGVLLWKFGRNRRLLVAIVGPLCLILFTALAPGNYGVRLLSIFIPSLDPVGSASARGAVLDRSILVSMRNPITGIGMGNFHTVSFHETVTHNAFTQVSAEMGFAALIIYLMFLTAPFKPLGRIERETLGDRASARYHYLAIALQASLVGFMVSAFFAAVAYQWYAYYLVAYAVCLRRIYASDKEASRVPAVNQATARPGSVSPYPLGGPELEHARKAV